MLDYKKTENSSTFRKSFVSAFFVSLIATFGAYFFTHYNFKNIFILVSCFQFIIAFANGSVAFQGTDAFFESRFTRGYFSGSILGMIIVFLIAIMGHIWL